jgi:predicted dehydrogenase
MGDAFEDRLLDSLSTLKDDKDITTKVMVEQKNRFVGFNAYKEVIASGVDAVLLTTPPHFRPLHLKAAVEAGKHVFAEKPCAVDAPGVRSVLETCEAAKKKNLSVVSGLCLRYDDGFRETVKRIHGGDIGAVHTLQANDFRGGIWVKERQPDWTDMHWQLRNWYYFTWLSGDFNVEQHVHYLDVCTWVMNNEYPIKAIGMGGRTVRNEPKYGNIYDHFSIIYEYANGAKLFSNCRQQPNCAGDMCAYVAGSKGRAELTDTRRGCSIQSAEKWNFPGSKRNMYQTEHDELFASIRAGKPINNGEYMAKSSLLAIMGRMAAYTGQEITWQMAFDSKEDLSPPKYEWGHLETPEIAIPGKTKFH